MNKRHDVKMKASAAAIRRGMSVDGASFKNRYTVTCRGKDGRIKWTDYIDNIVVNTGLDDILDKYWKGSTYTAAHYVGLVSGTPTIAAGDTMASHAGWTEITAYDEANRATLTLGAVSGQSVDNSGSPEVFTISANSTTIGGIFITTNSTKGGTTGTLIAAGAFTAGNKTIDDNDTLTVTITLTAATA